MKIEMELFRSRVARRVFTLFVVSALAPILLLSLLSLGQINRFLTEQKLEDIRREDKSYALALLDRLLLADSQLAWMGRQLVRAQPTLQRGDDPLAGLDKGQSFREVRRLSAAELNDTSSTHLAPIRAGAVSALAFLESNKGVLIAVPQPRERSHIYLLRMVEPANPAAGYLLAELEHVFLFGNPESLSPESTRCVLSETAEPLFCSRPEVPLSADQLGQIRGSPSGRFDWQDPQGLEHLTTYWSLFLRPNFWIQRWTVLSQVETSVALVPIADLRTVVAIVVTLTLASVALLSVHQIRRTLIPLEHILEGVHRIGRKDFGHPIQVSSDDELETLATSINQMALTIDRQFHTLSTMAEIDQLILSSLKTDEIIRIVLTRTGDILRHDHIGVVILRSEDLAESYSLSRGGQARAAITHQRLLVTPAEVAVLKPLPSVRARAAAPDAPAYLEPLWALGSDECLTLPILVRDEVAALITLGYADRVRLVEDDILLARDFANRVAVALANANWEEQLYHLAHYDTLTGLPNRLLLKDRLHQALASAERQTSFVAVLFLDLDRFKNVNDSLGHVTGDYLLREVAARLTRILREEDTVSRLGGDEFVILVQQFRNLHESLSLTSAVAQKILSELSRPFRINDREIITTASLGIACYPTDGETGAELLKNADIAMYHAKASGKDNYQFYSKILNAEAVERLDLENALRHAIARGELELAYQPKVETKTRRICGAEALLRWTHPQRGRISPAVFIPIAEEIGLIVPIGEWVIREVCQQLRRWTDEGLSTVRVAVNLSPIQFRQPDLIERVLRVLGETGIDPRLLEFEITEGAAMENLSTTTSILKLFNALDFHLSIDDFGTGHSSLSYLKRFPVNTLKIDQSFVRQIHASSKDEAIIKSIVTLAHSLGFDVVAEGVETQEQFDYLSTLDCDVAQGYLFSPPVPAAAFGQMLGPSPEVPVGQRAVTERVANLRSCQS